MNPETITEYITANFTHVIVGRAFGDNFFFYDPDDKPENQIFPFATLVNSDAHDDFSDLNREGVFRLNIGVSKATFQSLFGFEKFEDLKNRFDFKTLDVVMPHPVYGMMFWVCVLSPSGTTFESVKPILSEAYTAAANKEVSAR